MKFTILALLLLLALVTAYEPTPDQTITEATHHIYIDTNHEVQVTRLAITNQHSKPISTFTHVVPSNVATKIAYVKAAYENHTDLDVHEFTLDATSNPQHIADHRHYNIALKETVQPHESYAIVITSGYHLTLTPFPSSILQGGIQRMLYNGYTNYFSMYPVLSYYTIVHTQSASVDSFTPRRGAEKNDKTISYQKVTSLAPKPFHRGEELTVHATNNAKFFNFETAERHFDLSTTGEVLANEQYFVVHNGAKLSGPFHRSIYDRNQHTSRGKGPEVESFGMVLPKTVNNIDFRDFNGNISTSRIIHHDDSVMLDLQLRYPLFGGWKSDFEVGYQYYEPDLTNKAVDEKGYVTFALPFGFPFRHACGDMLELSVLLPEGAADISWTTPFDLHSVSTKTVLSYKDVTGRTQVTFKAFNVVPNMWNTITVTYKQPTAMLFKGSPIIVYFLAAAVLGIAFLNFANLGLGSYKVDENAIQGVLKTQAQPQSQQQQQQQETQSVQPETKAQQSEQTTTTTTANEEQSGAKQRPKKSTTKKQ